MKSESRNRPLARFEQALDRYGADVERWPADLRGMAAELLDSSLEARALLADAVRLEAALDVAFAVPPVPIGLQARIKARVENRDLWLEWLAAFVTRPWRPVGAACVPLMFGFALGLSAADDTADLEDSVLVAFSESAPVTFEASDE